MLKQKHRVLFMPNSSKHWEGKEEKTAETIEYDLVLRVGNVKRDIIWTA